MAFPPLRLLRLANPVVRAVLESPTHRLLSGRLVLLGYEGHLSGRQFRIPLRYAETTAGSLVAIAVRPEEKLWWRSFRPPRTAVLTLRGRRVSMRGALVEDDEHRAVLEAYTTRFPRSARLAHEAAIVVFTPLTR